VGIVRKSLSICTLGLVDFRSDKERIARSTRHTAKQAKQQTKLLQGQLHIQQHAAMQAQSGAQQQINLQRMIAHEARVSAITSDIQRQAILSQNRELTRRTPETGLAQRIVQLDLLLGDGLITDQEYKTRRQAILDSI
jgi:hypothetical protein